MSRPGPPAPPVRAVVVAYGAPELLDLCLAPLAGGPAVIVVDNSSDRDVRSVVTRQGAEYVDPGTNLGFAGGVNVGLAKRGEADVLLLNPDATITIDQVYCAAALPARARPAGLRRPRPDHPGHR